MTMLKKLIITTALLTLNTFSAFAKPADTCTKFSNFAYSVVGGRNAGVDRLQLKEQVKSVIDKGKGSPFQQSDYLELSRIIDILYFHPEVTQDYAAQSYFQHCLTIPEDNNGKETF